MLVAIGDVVHSEKDEWMRLIAYQKQATTITNQAHFAIFELAVEMWAKPWIEDVSRNSFKASIVSCETAYVNFVESSYHNLLWLHFGSWC